MSPEFRCGSSRTGNCDATQAIPGDYRKTRFGIRPSLGSISEELSSLRMDEPVYLFDCLAGILYLAVGIRLLALYAHTTQKPELLLGTNYLLFGASFLLYELPAIAGEGFDSEWCAFAARVTYAVGVVPLLLFVSGVFRPGARWARWLVWGDLAVLFGGILISGLSGDVEGYSLGNPWFWFEWVGYTVPFVWIVAEARGAHVAAKKRVRLGFCKPVVANRYWLWMLFGALECVNSFALIFLYHEYALTEVWPGWGDYCVSGLEAAATGALWLVFFSPAFYQRWVERADSAAGTP
jgi:hypothetical protein